MAPSSIHVRERGGGERGREEAERENRERFGREKGETGHWYLLLAAREPCRVSPERVS